MKQDQKTIEVKMDKEWVDALAAGVAMRENRPAGIGWKTRQEIQDMIGGTRDSTKLTLQNLGASGVVEKQTGTMFVNGRLQGQTWYRIKKGTK